MAVSTKRRPTCMKPKSLHAVPIRSSSPPDVVMRFNPVYSGDGTVKVILCETKVVGGLGWVHTVFLEFCHGIFETHVHPKPAGPNLKYIDDPEFVKAYLAGMGGTEAMDVRVCVLWVSRDGVLNETESTRRVFTKGDVTA